MPLTRTLTIGMTGEDVAILQKGLRALDIPVRDSVGTFSDSTRKAVLIFQRRNQLQVSGNFDKTTLEKLAERLGNDPFRGFEEPERPNPRAETEPLVVTGLVLHPDGKPVIGAVVVGVAKGLVAAHDREFAKARTDTDGRYVMKGEVPEGGFDIVIELRARRGGQRVTRSPLIVGAIGTRTVDLVVNNPKAYPRQSEFDELKRQLDPLLEGIDDPGALDTDTVAVLQARTGLSPIRIAHFLKAADFARRDGAPGAEAYYALFRANLPANGPALAAIDDTVLARALRTASEAGVVSDKIARGRGTIDDMLKAVNAAEVDTILKQPDLRNGAASLATFLDVAGLDTEGRQSFVALAGSHTGTSAELWDKLADAPGIGKEGRRRLEISARLSLLTLGNTALMKQLSDRVANDDADDPLRSLVALTEKDWLELVEGLDGTGLPPGFGVSGKQKPKPVYAKMMARMIEDAYPTPILATRMGDRDFDGAGAVIQFLQDNPGLDLSTGSVREYALANDITLEDDTRAGLESVQRIFALSPRFERYEVMQPILARGVTSAYQIRSMGQSQWMQTFSGPMGEARALTIYDNAQAKTAVATSLIGRYGAGFNNVAMNVLPGWNIPAIIDDLSNAFPTVDEATWESLFGNIDFCDCEHCNSVYSPAAYMVALLKFLRDRGLIGELNSRRPEIGALHLTCDNTNITLPYVDLAIEILEGFLTDTSAAHNTTGNVRDLRVHPEHINPDAYTFLEGEVFPWVLPFSLWTEEARSYLGPLDTTRAELLDVFHPTPRADRSAPERLAVAIEHLGLTEIQRDLILIATFSAAHWNNVSLNNLRTVQTLIDTARIPFLELRQLLDSRFVNPTGALQIQYAVGEGEDAEIVCDLSLARIEALATSDLNRIERFTRLRRALGWSVHELDVALSAAAGNIVPGTPIPLAADALVTLSDLKWLHEHTKVDIAVLASWIADLDTRDWLNDKEKTRVSTYASLFLNRTIGSAEDLAPFELAALGPAEVLGDHEAAILAALRIITAEELSLIRTRRLSDGNLTLENLSELHRIATMKRAFGISVRDLLDLLELSGVDPFSPATLHEARRLTEMLDLADATGFDLAELTYLFRDVHEAPASFVPNETQTTVFLLSLRTGLAQVRETYRAASDQTGEVAAQMLGSVVEADELPGVVAAIDFTADASDLPADPAASLNAAFASFLPDATVRAALIAQLVDDTDPGFLTPDVQRAERFAAVLAPLSAHLEREASAALVTSAFSDHLGLSVAATETLLGVVASTANPGDPASALFLDPAFAEVETAIDAAAYPDHFTMVRLLLKAALILSRLEIPAEDLPDLVSTAGTFNWIDFNTLPLAEAPGTAAFAAWVNTAGLYALAQRVPAAEASFLSFVIAADAGGDAAAFSTFLDRLSARMRWPRDELDTFTDAARFALDDFNSDWQGESALANLLLLDTAFSMLKKLGVAPEMAWNWTASTVTRTIASEVKQAARAKFQPNQWYDMAEPIRDRLRDRQRATLVEAAIRRLNDPAIRDSEDLYNHFLMDVEMKPCFQTSRIVFATGAIQTFLQRVLMNLEDGASLSNSDAEQWKWMKNYRVWEANVKVFVTPENWIEPELRLEKSPFFKALEEELLQGDVTLETVELAYQGYLEKLDEVARLEVTGIWRENDTKTLHVIGRTKGKPNKYFYRRWEEARRWTPWEEIPIEIEADCVTPVIYNRRLYIFWFMTTVMAEEEVPSGSGTGDLPNRYLEIKLAWSQYRQRKWSGKRLTDFGLNTARTRYLTWQRIKPHAWRPRPVIKPNGDLFLAIEFSANGWGSTTLNPSQLAGDTGFLFVNDSQIETEDYGDGSENFALARPAKFTNSRAFYHGTFGFTPALEMRGSNGTYQKVLDDTPTSWRITTPLQLLQYSSSMPFIFEDRYRSYFVIPRHVYGHRPSFEGDLSIDLNPGIFMEFEDLIHIDELDLTDVVGPLPDPDPGFGPEIRPQGLENPARDTLPLIGGSRSTPGEFGGRVASARRLTGDSQPLLVQDMDTAVLGGDIDIVYETVRRDFEGNTAMAMMSENAPVGDGPTMALLRGDSGVDNFTIAAGEMAFADSVMAAAATPGTWTVHWANYLYSKYRFVPFYHPYVPKLVRQLNRYGVEGILNPREGGPEDDLRRQQTREPSNRQFDDIYDVGQRLDKTRLPVEEFDFEYGSPMSIYNWELFFHIPYMIATHLSRNQRFEDAQKWFHFIFDPTDNSDVPAAMNPYRFWKVKPFYENTDIRTVEEMMRLLSSSDPADLEARRDLEDQIKDWRKNPFQPHRIAEHRPVAYQKSVVMKYLDNLIAWADHLFRQDTRESVREATQIYVLASGILGKRPDRIPAPEGQKTIGGNPINSFNDLAPHLNDLDNALIMLETLLPPAEQPGANPGDGLAVTDSFLNPGGADDAGGITAPGSLVSNEPEDPPAPEIVGSTLFFCVPPNPKLLGYWDIVADRLFKIRHCLNIEGVERQLALFAPPIDPALLVRATAAGVDLSSVLSDLSAPRPHYRFQTMLRAALDLCADVKALGQALLSALEKRDAEELALLRQRHEEAVLKSVRAVRKIQVDEANEAITGLKKSLEGIEERRRFHETRDPLIPNEALHLRKLETAKVLETVASTTSAVASALAMIPEFDAGAEGGFSSPTVKVQFGGANLSKAASIGAQILNIMAAGERQDAQRASIVAGYDRRQEDWDFSAAQAAKDAENMESQIAAAELRLAVSEKELENQELLIEHSQEIHRHMREKYTNRDLYSWMVGQVSGLYFQSYQLAYDIAKRAERAFQHELSLPNASYISFGYWDSLRKGLLSGERLQLDLRRIEAAYREQNRREYEVTRHSSLAQIDPAALVQLRQTGRCEFEVPEAFFNLDHPSHYLRRIKSVSLTVPCVTGPYSGVNATLTLLQNRVRVNPVNADQPYTGPDDANFIVNTGGIQSVAISSGRDDAGLFQLSYQDERYLPFEGAGAISRWRIALADPFRGFDYDTISDVVLKIAYTAREGGQAVASPVVAALDTRLGEIVNATATTGLYRLFQLRRDFGTTLFTFLNPAGAEDHAASFELSPDLLPYVFRGRSITIDNVTALLELTDPSLYQNGTPLSLNLQRGAGATQPQDLLIAGSAFGGLPHAEYTNTPGPLNEGETWTLGVTAAAVQALPAGLRTSQSVGGVDVPRLRGDLVHDIGLLVHYTVS